MNKEKRKTMLQFHQLAAHRREFYKLGEIPNLNAEKYCGSPILFLTCAVNVNKNYLSVLVCGWTSKVPRRTCWLIDYEDILVDDGEDTANLITSPVWQRLRGIIKDREYEADDGEKQIILTTLINSGFAHRTVVEFCKQLEDDGIKISPVLGRARLSKPRKCEMTTFPTHLGTTGYRITMDHYKDRLDEILRQTWSDQDEQPCYTFNAPIDLPDRALKELTVERQVVSNKDPGHVYWLRPGRARNHLWNLLVYGYANVME